MVNQAASSTSYPVSVLQEKPITKNKSQHCYLIQLVQTIWTQFTHILKKIFNCSSKKIEPSVSLPQPPAHTIPTPIASIIPPSPDPVVQPPPHKEEQIEPTPPDGINEISEDIEQVIESSEDEDLIKEVLSQSEGEEKEPIYSVSEDSEKTAQRIKQVNDAFDLFVETVRNPQSISLAPSVEVSDSSNDYIVRVNAAKWTIKEEQDLENLIEKELKPLVYAAQEKVKLELREVTRRNTETMTPSIVYSQEDIEEGMQRRRFDELEPRLAKEFDVYRDRDFLVLSPKELSRSADGNEITFIDGSILTIQNKKYGKIIGHRKWVNGDIEKGEFEYKGYSSEGKRYVLIKGTRKRGEEIIHVFHSIHHKPEKDAEGVEWLYAKVKDVYQDFRILRKVDDRFECTQEKRKYPFTPFEIEINGTKLSIATQNEEQLWLQKLQLIVDGEHQQIKINVLDKNKIRILTSLLEEHFDVHETNLDVLEVKPKMAEPPFIEGNKVTTRYTNGTVSEFKKKKNRKSWETYFYGKRRSASDRIEQGKFKKEGAQSLFHGTITQDGVTHYVLLKPLFISKSGCTIAKVPNAQGIKEWKVLRLIPGCGPLQWRIDVIKSARDVVQENLLARGIGENLKKFYREGVLTADDMPVLLPLLFQSHVENEPPPIFSYYATKSFVLKIAKKLKIPLDLQVTRKSDDEEEPFFMTLNTSKEIKALAAYNPELFSQKGEDIFTSLIKTYDQELLQVDFSSCVFNPMNHFLREMLYQPYTEKMLEQFETLSGDDQYKSAQLANHYQRFDFAKALHTLEERPWEPQVKEMQPMDGNPMRFLPFITPSMPVEMRREAAKEMLKELRVQKLLLTEEEFNLFSEGYSENSRFGIQSLVGRKYLEEMIGTLELKHIKLPEQRAILLDPKTGTFSVDVTSNGKLFSNEIMVMEKKIASGGKVANGKQLVELFTLLETMGFTFERENFWNCICIAQDDLYLLDTNYERFQSFPSYSIIESLLKPITTNEDKQAIQELLDQKKADYKKTEVQRIEFFKQKRAIQKTCDDFYGDQHTFTFTLQELGISEQ